eukprot:16370-Amorphochlora_amoeboformis.AAC.1
MAVSDHDRGFLLRAMYSSISHGVESRDAFICTPGGAGVQRVDRTTSLGGYRKRSGALRAQESTGFDTEEFQVNSPPCTKEKHGTGVDDVCSETDGEGH